MADEVSDERLAYALRWIGVPDDAPHREAVRSMLENGDSLPSIYLALTGRYCPDYVRS